MKAAIALTVVLSLGCVTASPTFVKSKGLSSSSSSASYSASMSSSSSYNYYKSDVCTAIGFTIREDLVTTIFDELEQKFLEKKCELLNSYGVYPKDISPLFCDSTSPYNYDIIVVGSAPAGLSALQSLAALGKKILVIDKGYFPTAQADSLYYRSSLYTSDYVNSYPGYINGVEITKNLYTSSVLGGLSVLDTNTWNIGSQLLYKQLAEINDQFAWEKIANYYKGLESYKTYKSVSVTKSTSTSSSSSSSSSSSQDCSSFDSSYSSSSSQTTTTTTKYEYSAQGTYSIYNTLKESYLTRTLSSVLEELGYSSCPCGFELSPNKYTILPVLGERDKPTLFPYTVFKALEQYKNNIDLALRTKVEQIIFEGKKATGVKVRTPSGQEITIYANDKVILSTDVISTYELLFKSGCGPEELLKKYNYPVTFPVPSLGNGIILPPVYHGLCLKFPKGSLLDDCDSDVLNLAYAFGYNELSATVSLNYYRAYLAVKGAKEANIALKFYAFSESTSIRLKNMMNSQFQFDSSTQEYILSLISEYDILIVGTHLLAPRSTGVITYKDNCDTPHIELGMFSDEYDIECILEAIEQVKALAQTQSFQNLNGEIIQFPVQNCNGDYFSPDFNKQSIYYHSVPSLYMSGGLPMGVDYKSAVVDKALRLLGTDNVHIFSPCVSPYPLYSDSSAFSIFIGTYGAEVIINEYNGIFLDSITISASSDSSTAISSSSSSYSSRDISASSSSYSSTDINQVSGNGASVYSSSSKDVNSSSYNEEQQSATTAVVGPNGAVSQQSSSSSNRSNNYEAEQSSSSVVKGANGALSQQSSSSSNSSSNYGAEQSSSSVVKGANGYVSQQSKSKVDASSSASNSSKTSYSSGANGIEASSYQSSAQSASYNAQQESSSVIAGAGEIAC